MIYKVSYNFKDGGSKWFVRALNRVDALKYVKDYFWRHFGHHDHSASQFYVTSVCEEVGEVVSGD